MPSLKVRIPVSKVQVGDSINSPFGHHVVTIVAIQSGMYGLIELVGMVDGDRHLLSLEPNEMVTLA